MATDDSENKLCSHMPKTPKKKNFLEVAHLFCWYSVYVGGGEGRGQTFIYETDEYVQVKSMQCCYQHSTLLLHLQNKCNDEQAYITDTNSWTFYNTECRWGKFEIMLWCVVNTILEYPKHGHFRSYNALYVCIKCLLTYWERVMVLISAMW